MLFSTGKYECCRKCSSASFDKGSETTDADKQAAKDAKSGVWPNPLLLKARLLNDGGYNNEAIALLTGKSTADFTKQEDKLEFAYRIARIYDDVGRDSEAIKMYLLAIKLGEDRQNIMLQERRCKLV